MNFLLAKFQNRAFTPSPQLYQDARSSGIKPFQASQQDFWELAQQYERVIKDNEQEIASLKDQLRQKKAGYKECLRGLLQEVGAIRSDLKSLRNDCGP